MPAKSQQQLKLIYAKRNQYGSKSDTPEKWKWVWDEEWTDDVKFKDLPEKVEESVLNREEYIKLIKDVSDYDDDDLCDMDDEEIKDLCDSLYCENWDERIEEFDVVERKVITRFDDFMNEGKKHKGEKLRFEDWWKKTYEKKADYWVEKKEIKQGYQSGELTRYYERKIRSKYNKYLKKRRK